MNRVDGINTMVRERAVAELRAIQVAQDAFIVLPLSGDETERVHAHPDRVLYPGAEMVRQLQPSIIQANWRWWQDVELPRYSGSELATRLPGIIRIDMP
jgi:hypothetical protein